MKGESLLKTSGVGREPFSRSDVEIEAGGIVFSIVHPTAAAELRRLVERTPERPVTGIPQRRLALLRDALAVTESGIDITGSKETGYTLSVPDGAQVNLRSINTINLPDGMNDYTRRAPAEIFCEEDGSIISFRKTEVDRTFGRLYASNEPVRGLSPSQIQETESALAKTKTGIRIIGDNNTGYDLEIPDGITVIVREIKDIFLPGDEPQ